MTLPAWPAELPRPMRSGYQAQNMDPRIRRSGETGPPSYRRRYSSVARRVALVIDVPRALKATFEIFHEQVLSHGALPFTMPDPTTDGWPLLMSDGTPVLTAGGVRILLARQWVCLFGEEPPVEQVIGVRFRLEFGVVVMP